MPKYISSRYPKSNISELYVEGLIYECCMSFMGYKQVVRAVDTYCRSSVPILSALPGRTPRITPVF